MLAADLDTMNRILVFVRIGEETISKGLEGKLKNRERHSGKEKVEGEIRSCWQKKMT